MIFSYASGVYKLRTEQILPVSIDQAWEYFSSPKNLQKITPDDLDFIITSGEPEPMFAGQLITYKIKLFPFLRSSWITEITHVSNSDYFIDEQRFGPYKMWHHLHRFTSLENKVLMEDIVHFKLPLGWLGRLFFPILIKPRLQHIFQYRYRKLEELFGKPEQPLNKGKEKLVSVDTSYFSLNS